MSSLQPYYFKIDNRYICYKVNLYIQLYSELIKMQTFIFSKALLKSGWANNVYIEVDDQGQIANISADYKGEAGDKVLGYAMPGMNNVHSHAFQRAMAGLAEYSTSKSDSFWTWRDLMYRFAQVITPEDLISIAAQLYLEMLKAGYVSVGEFHYLHNSEHNTGDEMSHAIMTAADQTGLGLCHLPVLYMSAGFGGLTLNEKQKRFGHEVDEYLKLIENLNRKMSDQDNQHLGMAFHSLRAVPEDAIMQCLKDSAATGPIHIHISEQLQEVNDCLDWSGMRPVEWLYDHADVDEKWCLIHATHLNDDEVSSIAKSGAVVGLCPTTEANLGDGLFPLTSFMEQGGRIAIGSDSHVSISMIEELRLLEYGQRLKNHSRNVATSKNDIHTGSYLYHENLSGGAQASGFNNGSLEVGKRADIIVLDKSSPLLVGTPERNIIDRFIFNGNVNPIKHVMVAGKMVISDYHHPLGDQITAEFTATMIRLQKYLD